MERVFPMVISSEFRMGQYRADNHREYTTHFSNLESNIGKKLAYKLLKQ